MFKIGQTSNLDLLTMLAWKQSRASAFGSGFIVFWKILVTKYASALPTLSHARQRRGPRCLRPRELRGKSWRLEMWCRLRVSHNRGMVSTEAGISNRAWTVEELCGTAA